MAGATIPKLVKGLVFPSLLEPRRRVGQAFWAVMMEAYVHGTSTRKVDDLVVALGVDTGVSKSTVSRICAQLDAQVAQFRDRPLDHTAFPYVFLGVDVGDSEDEIFWTAFLRRLPTAGWTGCSWSSATPTPG